MAAQLGVGQRAFQQLLSRTLLAEVAADYGLAISDDLLRNTVVNNPAFQTSGGRFDRTLFQQVLFNSGLNEETYLAGLRGDLAREQLVSSLVARITPQGHAGVAVSAFAAVRFLLTARKRISLSDGLAHSRESTV